MTSTSPDRGVAYKGPGMVEGIDLPKLVNPTGTHTGYGVILRFVASRTTLETIVGIDAVSEVEYFRHSDILQMVQRQPLTTSFGLVV